MIIVYFSVFSVPSVANLYIELTLNVFDLNAAVS